MTYYREEFARFRGAFGFKSAPLAIADARAWVAENVPPHVAQLLRVRRGPASHYVKGLRIEKWGDFEWALDHGNFLFVNDMVMTGSSASKIRQSQMVQMIEQGRVFVANQVD